MEVVSLFILVWWMTYYFTTSACLISWCGPWQRASARERRGNIWPPKKSRMYWCCCPPVELRPSSLAWQRALCAGRWESIGSSCFEGWVMAGRGRKGKSWRVFWPVDGGPQARSPVKVQPTVDGGPVGAGRVQTAGDSITAAAHEMEDELIQSRALKRISTLSVNNRGLSVN